jgi:HAD superfamily hydrolase (TIGR01509 family)
MSLRAVLLDIDGTLLDSNDAHARAWCDVLGRNGHEVAYYTIRPLIGKGGDKLLEEAVGIAEQSEEGRVISNQRRSRFAEAYLQSLKPTAGARALLHRLRGNGFRLIVATSAGNEELRSLLQQAGVGDLIENAVSANDVTRSKPDPDIVLAALGKAGLRADEAIMLGDTPYDIQAAISAGVPTIALRCGGWWNDDSFAGASAIFDDPADLLHHLDTSPLHQRASVGQ